MAAIGCKELGVESQLDKKTIDNTLLYDKLEGSQTLTYVRLEVLKQSNNELYSVLLTLIEEENY
jgi:hypothetical protein